MPRRPRQRQCDAPRSAYLTVLTAARAAGARRALATAKCDSQNQRSARGPGRSARGLRDARPMGARGAERRGVARPRSAGREVAPSRSRKGRRTDALRHLRADAHGRSDGSHCNRLRRAAEVEKCAKSAAGAPLPRPRCAFSRLSLPRSQTRRKPAQHARRVATLPLDAQLQAQPLCAMGLGAAPDRTRTVSFSSPPRTADAPPPLQAPRTPDADERWRRGFRSGSSRAANSCEHTGSPLRRAASAGVHAAYAVDISLVSPAFQVSLGPDHARITPVAASCAHQPAPIAYSPRPAACQALLPALSGDPDTSDQLVNSCCQRLGVVRVPPLRRSRAGPARLVRSVGALTRSPAPRPPTTWRSSRCARCRPARRRRPARASPSRCARRRSLWRRSRRCSRSAQQHTQQPRTRSCSCRRRARSCSASARRACRRRCAHSRRNTKSLGTL